jgi:hypothetical protein
MGGGRFVVVPERQLVAAALAAVALASAVAIATRSAPLATELTGNPLPVGGTAMPQTTKPTAAGFTASFRSRS